MKKGFFSRLLSTRTAMLTIFVVFFSMANLTAQVTTSSISGVITDSKTKESVIGASVVAVHVPSGTRYAAITNEDGRYFMPSVRVGGPYKVTVSFVGYKEAFKEGISAPLGSAANVNVAIGEDAQVMEEVVITANKADVFSSNRTGAASTVNSAQLAALPTIGARSINDFTKYNPQGNGRSFGGQDSRLNNITIDGSVFNNGFGLGNSATAGGRTGSTAISLDAIEEIQINVAPFDVRQSNFVGAGVNAVTRSGTNDFQGSAYTFLRNENLVGDQARQLPVTVNRFQENIIGARLGGPIIKDKLFFFVNYEGQRRTDPGTQQVAFGSPNAGVPTRVAYADMTGMSTFLNQNFKYETGAFENFDFLTKSDKFLARLDYNISDQHKASVRYSNHQSIADIQISNSNSLGNGNRINQANGFSMSYENSGYLQRDNTSSIVGELNSTFGSKAANTFIVSYNVQNEDRAYKYKWPGDASGEGFFPTVDILNGASDRTTYMAIGFDPFTPKNQLNYRTTQVTNNFRYFMGKNTFTLGASFERFTSNNMFFPGSHAVYTFTSLQDFYNAANQFIATPNSTTPLTTPVRIQYRYSALPGGADPLQKLATNTIAGYIQDEIAVTKNLTVSPGIRASIIGFDQTALTNTVFTEGSNFKDAFRLNGNPYTINTGALPPTKILWEPRVGFNWDVLGDKSLQVRGGTGMFTGRPPFVWISNQIGNNGILTGFIDSTVTRLWSPAKGQFVNPFTTDPSVFRPTNAAAPASYDLAFTDENYRFPQVWKTNFAIDKKLPGGFVASVEALYNQNVNAVLYEDVNQAAPIASTFLGPDQRLLFGNAPRTLRQGADTFNLSSRIRGNVSNAMLMSTTNKGYNYILTVKLEKTLTKDWGGMIAYSYSRTRDLMSAGSIAAGSWTGVAQSGGSNELPMAFSNFDLPHRVIGYASYRIGYNNGKPFGGDFTLSLGVEASQSARFSYIVGGDANYDGVNNNDLFYVPTSDDIASGRFAFVPNRIAALNTTFTPQQQAAAFEAYIQQDEYLSTRRGQFTERNAGLLPWLTSFDLSAIKNLNLKIGNSMNTLQLRMDCINVGNLLNKNWGVGQRIVGGTPVTFAGLAADGRTPTYRLATQTVTNPDATTSTFLLRDTYVNRNQLGDVWQIQLGVRYIFN
jgi:hypothetical protein